MSKDPGSEEKHEVNLEMPEVEQELSKVAANPKQSMVILGLVIAAFLYLFFNLFMSDSDKTPSTDTPVPDNVVKPVQVQTDNTIPPIPTLPTPPKLEDPTLPPPPPAADLPEIQPLAKEAEPPLPIDAAKGGTPSDSAGALPLPFDGKIQNDEDKKRLEAKRKSSIVLIAGKPVTKTPEQIEQEADFKQRGDMHLVLGRGKMIDVIVESAINTDFGGEIRAVVSRDVYSEWGRNILISKGSRVFGQYTTSVDGAYGRVMIEWTRIDLSTGYTLNISGTGTDALGRKGQQGRVDNKFKEQFANTVLRSIFNVNLASTLDKMVKPVKSSQTAATQTANANNITTTATNIFSQTGVTSQTKFAQICSSTLAAITDTTSSAYTSISNACSTLLTQPGATPDIALSSLMSVINSAAATLIQDSTISTQPSQAQEATKQAFIDMSDTVKKLLDQQTFKVNVTIDQGTPIKIYVNKDYKFPGAAIKKVIK